MEINPTAQFIIEKMTNRNGTLATYLLEHNTMDTPLGQGRNALSQSLAYWLQYAFERRDPVLFHDGYQLLTTYFMEEDGFIYGEVDESGKKMIAANSLSSDFRIICALFKAGDYWDKRQYQDTAEKISQYLNTHNKREDLLIDFYNKNSRQTSHHLTLSSVHPMALKEMKAHGVIEVKSYIKMIDLLDRIPKQNGFYAKSYNVKEKKFIYDSDINMIDQALVALHRAEEGTPPDSFFRFIKNEFNQNGVIYKKYKKDSKLPSVHDESPALYGISVLYSLRVGDVEFAHTLFKKMVQLREENPFSPIYGGYSFHVNGDSAILDNLVALVAEEVLTHHQLIIK